MDAVRDRMQFDLDVMMVGASMLGTRKQRQARRFRQANSAKYRKCRCVRGLHAGASTITRIARYAQRFRRQRPRNTVNTEVVGVGAARVNNPSVPSTNHVRSFCENMPQTQVRTTFWHFGHKMLDLVQAGNSFCRLVTAF